jgi:uncharacterized protein YjbI with pentapeptide repeats
MDMANPEHVDILRQGAVAWNRWRKHNPKIIPDLKNADLKGTDLSEANLIGANLEEADLTGATIWNADFSRAFLKAANLGGADLSGANLNGADLSDANLEGTDLVATKLSSAILNNANFSKAIFTAEDFKPADFSYAKLRDANLNGVNLREADLTGADLTGADLTGADLSRARLFNTKLGKAILTNANLNGTNLSGINLSGTNLSRASLVRVKLRAANLSKVNLSGANLSYADFNGGNLVGANLSEAIISEADLSEANLRWADFSGADLIAAYIFASDLTGVNLSKADLYAADFKNANLCKAKLSGASLQAARLLDTKLDGATLTGACLWETQRAGWSIKGVICEYVYWDEAREIRSIYSPSEFERLFADRTKVRLFYKDGINPLEIATIPALIKHLEALHPGVGLRLVNIREDSGGVVVELAIEGDKLPEQLKYLKEALETEAQQKAEYLRQALNEREANLQLQGEVKQLTSFVDKLIARGSIIMGDTNTYNVSGQAGAVGENASASNMTFNQIVNHFEKTIDLFALATQLGELREEMTKRQDSSPQAAIARGEAAKAEMAAKEGNTSKVVEYLKAGGQALLDIAKETSKELLTSAIKTSMGMQ